MIGYLCAYLRYYYPTEFIAAYLNNANNADDIIDGTYLAKQKGIKIVPIKFRRSKGSYTPSPNEKVIYKGIASIKFLSNELAERLYELRDLRFDSFIDFLKINPCDSRATKILIKLDFFSEFGKSKKLLKEYQIFNDLYGKVTLKKDTMLYDKDKIAKYSKETAKTYKLFDSEGLIKELCSEIKDESIPLKERLDTEKEYLGYISYVNTKLPRVAYVEAVDNRYSPRVRICSLSKGKTSEIRISKSVFKNNPLEIGDIIAIKEFHSSLKSRKTENGFEKIPGTTEWWVKSYAKVVI